MMLPCCSNQLRVVATLKCTLCSILHSHCHLHFYPCYSPVRFQGVIQFEQDCRSCAWGTEVGSFRQYTTITICVQGPARICSTVPRLPSFGSPAATAACVCSIWTESRICSCCHVATSEHRFADSQPQTKSNCLNKVADLCTAPTLVPSGKCYNRLVMQLYWIKPALSPINFHRQQDATTLPTC